MMTININIYYFKMIISLFFIILHIDSYAWVSVGSSPGFGTCNYASIQEAIDSGEFEIRVLNNQEFIENLTIDHSVSLQGGYTSCLSAQLNFISESNTVIRGIAATGAPVVNISTDQNALPVPLVKLMNVTLTGGLDTQFVDGGNGIRVSDSSVIIGLIDSKIINNFAENGAGIFVENPTFFNVYLINSQINNNESMFNGGGIFCSNSSAIIDVYENSQISDNKAQNGAGIYASNGCTVNLYSGIESAQIDDLSGITKNHAFLNGGGIYARNNSNIYLIGNEVNTHGDNSNPVSMSLNTANNNGGGIYATENSNIEIYNGYIYKNSSLNNGGAMYLSDDSSLMISQANDAECWDEEHYCSVIFENSAGFKGGAIYANSLSHIEVSQSKIFNNRAAEGTVIYQSDADTKSVFINNYIYKNGNDNSDDYLDAFVFYITQLSSASFYHNSIINNDINNLNAIFKVTSASVLNIYNSIIENNELILTKANDSIILSSCNLVDENNSLSGLLIQQPLFIDKTQNNFQLNSNSDAIDLCADLSDSINQLKIDINYQNRPFDDAATNIFGDVDAGAEESYINDLVFKNNFDE